MPLPILTYHSVLPAERIKTIPPERDNTYVVGSEAFEEHLMRLKASGYETLSFEELIRLVDDSKSIPHRSVIITFDDGQDDNHDVALPILKKYGFKATFFIVTDLIGKKDFLNWDQVRELSDSGMEIQSHTHSHRDLSEADGDAIRHELELSKSIIEERTGRRVRALSLPNGRGDDTVLRRIAEPLGYRFVCNSTWGENRLSRKSFFLNRFTITIGSDMDQFKSFVEMKRSTLMVYKTKRVPARLMRLFLGRTLYPKLRRFLVNG